MSSVDERIADVSAAIDRAVVAWKNWRTACAIAHDNCLPAVVSATEVMALKKQVDEHFRTQLSDFGRHDLLLREAIKRAGQHIHKATPKQVALLHVAARELRLNDAAYDIILTTFGRQASTADVEQLGFENMKQFMVGVGFEPKQAKPKPEDFGRRRAMASPSQIAAIRRLWFEWSSRPEGIDDTDLNAWLAKFHHVSALRFVDATKAGKVLNSLRSMAARKASDAAKGSSPVSPAAEPRINRVSKGAGRAASAKTAGDGAGEGVARVHGLLNGSGEKSADR